MRPGGDRCSRGEGRDCCCDHQLQGAPSGWGPNTAATTHTWHVAISIKYKEKFSFSVVGATVVCEPIRPSKAREDFIKLRGLGLGEGRGVMWDWPGIWPQLAC